jgi:four helix bundle protein
MLPKIAVVVRDFRGLVCWQLSRELKCEVFAFTSEGPASHDFKCRDQIRDSSASATSNIAEGFGRFTPGEFAQYLKWARASLMETQDHLIDGHDRRYLSDRLFSRLSNLAAAALKTTTNLMLTKQQQARMRAARVKPGMRRHHLRQGRDGASSSPP